jgi:hypothetical protein
MNKVNHLRTLTCLLLVLFLFAPILVRSLSALGDQQGVKKTGFAKHASGTSKSDGQFLYEEKEKEEKSSDNHISTFTSLFVNLEFEQATLLATPEYSFVSPLPLGGKLPLFLTQRTILI